VQSPIQFITDVEKNRKKNLILFVHGFTSDSQTWVNSKGKSLPEMLLEEPFIKDNFDMAFFNYFTKLVDFKKVRFGHGIVKAILGRSTNIKKNIGIDKLSDFMKSSIDAFCRGYTNIILISHSMGGLISKSYILNDLLKNEEPKVKLFLSLAVPHKGSNWANIGKKLTFQNPQVIDLQPMSDFLDEVNNDWIQQKNELPKTVYYYGHYDDIVDEKSAISFQLEEQLKVPCDQDHFNITKPDSKQSVVYQTIKNYLEDYLKDEQFKKDMEPKEFIDDGKLDDEIFVLKLLIADVHNHLIRDSKETFFEAEYTLKALINKGYSINDVQGLYKKIERLYIIYFMKFVNGEIKTSNELVTKIYESIIDKDKAFLEIAIPLIDANKKTGMLNQLANNLDKEIWWAKNHSIMDIDAFRKARDVDGE
jgi:hypothetical protein